MRRRVLPTVCTFRCLVCAAAAADGEVDRTLLAEEAAWIAHVADLAPAVHQRAACADPRGCGRSPVAAHVAAPIGAHPICVSGWSEAWIGARPVSARPAVLTVGRPGHRAAVVGIHGAFIAHSWQRSNGGHGRVEQACDGGLAHGIPPVRDTRPVVAIRIVLIIDRAMAMAARPAPRAA